ncbi:MAG: DUF523 domain-containing protein [Mariprofundaceae bacterium]
MQKILISACLIGENVRFDGKNSANSSKIIEKWKKSGVFITVCPEVEGGLPVPRPPAEIQPDKRIINIEGEDVSEPFELGAQKALTLCRENNIHVAILKEGSPSCGSSLINNGAFSHRKIAGQGVTTIILESNGIRVFSENELEQAEHYFKSVISSG